MSNRFSRLNSRRCLMVPTEVFAVSLSLPSVWRVLHHAGKESVTGPAKTRETLDDTLSFDRARRRSESVADGHCTLVDSDVPLRGQQPGAQPPEADKEAFSDTFSCEIYCHGDYIGAAGTTVPRRSIGRTGNLLATTSEATS